MRPILFIFAMVCLIACLVICEGQDLHARKLFVFGLVFGFVLGTCGTALSLRPTLRRGP